MGEEYNFEGFCAPLWAQGLEIYNPIASNALGPPGCPENLDVRKTWTSGDLEVRKPGRPESLDVRKTWTSGDLDVRKTWTSGDLDVQNLDVRNLDVRLPMIYINGKLSISAIPHVPQQ